MSPLILYKWKDEDISNKSVLGGKKLVQKPTTTELTPQCFQSQAKAKANHLTRMTQACSTPTKTATLSKKQ